MDREMRSSIVLDDFPSLDKLTGKEIDRRARAAGETFVIDDRLKTHQLRNIFSAIEKIRVAFQTKKKPEEGISSEEELLTQLILLKPKLAYAAGRQKSVRYHLFPFLEKAIDGVDNAPSGPERTKAFRNFFALMESVVGYHKYFENQ
jgi:CRISPR-associated protein Csm2